MFKILIVNNQYLIRKTIRKIIEDSKLSREIIEKTTQNQALSYVKDKSLDIIIIDLISLSMNILDFLKEIRRIDKNIKVYFLAYDGEIYKLNKLGIKIDNIILRPRLKKDLLNKLKELREGYIYVDTDDFFKKFDLVLKEKDIKKTIEFTKKYINQLSDGISNLVFRKKLNYLIERILKYKATKSYDFKNLFKLENLNIKNPLVIDSLSFKIITYYYKLRAIETYPILNEVFSYIDDNIYKNISLKDVVLNCNISQGYLSRLFKSQLHMTVVNYINLEKINIAKNLIINKNLTIFELADKLDYSDYSYFSKVFKKHADITVEEFKKNMRQDIK